MKISYISPAFCFAAFVFWLVSVAMEGPLTAALGIKGVTGTFLPVHAASLLVAGLFCPERIFVRLLPAGCVLTAGITVFLPLAGPQYASVMIAAMGVTGAAAAIGACITLRYSPAPLLSAALGLCAANLLLLPLIAAQKLGIFHFTAAAIPLLAIPIIAARVPQQPIPDRAGPWHYLPFILLFKVVCGLMYSFIMPAYNSLAVMPGAELILYVLAVLAGYYIIKINLDLSLICGVVLGMTAFTLMQTTAGSYPVNIGMFALQGATGFVDIVLISIMLALSGHVRAFGIGLAATCTGIIAGELIGGYFADITEAIVISGHFVLNLSVLTLYFLGRHGYMTRRRMEVPVSVSEYNGALEKTENPGAEIPEAAGRRSNTSDSAQSDNDGEMPKYLRLLLSERECSVLTRVMSGMNYRETAREMEISESTVKTYMHRIFEKMGVNGKKKLFEKLNKL